MITQYHCWEFIYNIKEVGTKKIIIPNFYLHLKCKYPSRDMNHAQLWNHNILMILVAGGYYIGGFGDNIYITNLNHDLWPCCIRNEKQNIVVSLYNLVISLRRACSYTAHTMHLNIKISHQYTTTNLKCLHAYNADSRIVANHKLIIINY